MKLGILLSVANREHEAFHSLLCDQLIRTRFFEVVARPFKKAKQCSDLQFLAISQLLNFTVYYSVLNVITGKRPCPPDLLMFS